MTPIPEGRAIARIAQARGISVHELSDKSGIAATTIYRLVNGTAQTVRVSTLYSLAQVLGVTVDDLREPDIDLATLPPMPVFADTLSTPVAAPAASAPATSGVPLYRLAQTWALGRGDTARPLRSVSPPPFEEYKGQSLIALEVPPGRRRPCEGVEVGDVLYARLWKREETPDPMDQDLVLCINDMVEGAVSLVRWTLTPPEGLRPFGRVVCFARSWI